MREFVVRIVDEDGRILRRFVAVARSYAVAVRRGYEIAAETSGAAYVYAVEV